MCVHLVAYAYKNTIRLLKFIHRRRLMLQTSSCSIYSISKATASLMTSLLFVVNVEYWPELNTNDQVNVRVRRAQFQFSMEWQAQHFCYAVRDAMHEQFLQGMISHRRYTSLDECMIFRIRCFQTTDELHSRWRFLGS